MLTVACQEWELLAEKARRWLEREWAKITSPDGKTVEDLLREAASFIA